MRRSTRRSRGTLLSIRLLAPIAASALAVALVAPPTSGRILASPTCHGKTATIVGTDGPDTLKATRAKDVIVAKAGADTITGINGLDTVCAGDGNDAISISSSDGQSDLVDGGKGSDTIVYETGKNDLVWIDLGAGIAMETINTSQGPHNKLVSIENARTGSERDVVAGGPGVNHIDLGAGDDKYAWTPGDAGNDSIDGGDGADWLLYTRAPGPVTVDLPAGTASGPGTGSDSVEDFENVSGSFLGNTFTGSGGDNDLVSSIMPAFGGSSTIDAGGGNDIIVGSTADDTISGGAGNDDAEIGPYGTATVDGGPGDDVLRPLPQVFTYSYPGSVTAHGGAGDDNMEGGSGNDTLYGDDGSDIVESREGDDTLYGGPDSDFLDGGTGQDSCPDAGSEDTGYGGCASPFGPDPNVGQPLPPAPQVDLSVAPAGDPDVAGGKATYTFTITNPGSVDVNADFWAFFPALVLDVSFPGYSGDPQFCQRPFVGVAGEHRGGAGFYDFLGRTVGCAGVHVPAGGSTTVTATTQLASNPLDGLVVAYDGAPYGSESFDPVRSNNVSPFAPAPSVTLTGPAFAERGDPFTLTATVTPCKSGLGPVGLLRQIPGPDYGKLRSAAVDPKCQAKFELLIRETSTYKARANVSGKQIDSDPLTVTVA